MTEGPVKEQVTIVYVVAQGGCAIIPTRVTLILQHVCHSSSVLIALSPTFALTCWFLSLIFFLLIVFMLNAVFCLETGLVMVKVKESYTSNKAINAALNLFLTP